MQPPLPSFGDIPAADFDRAARRALEWVERYLENPERFPVLSHVAPGEVRAALPASPPARGESLDAILDDFERVVIPGITHWNHPGFFAYFAISSSAPGIIGELLAAALNVNGMLWKTSPSATELEQVALDWLRQLMGLEGEWFGTITDTASISTMLALAAAREAAGLDVRERGLAGRPEVPAMRVYCSTQSHSSVDKGAIALGLGHRNVVHVETDGAFRMRPDLLAEAITRDRAAGFLPIAAVATVGTTSTTSIDPVREIADVCRREGMWLHVDGAYGGVAAIVPELRDAVLDGVALADSLVVNPHKWLFTPIDCSAFYTRRPEVLKQAFSLVPEYLRTDVAGSGYRVAGSKSDGPARTAEPLPATPDPLPAVDLMEYGVQLGRRFRALKLWMVIRAFGAEGLAARVRQHMTLARELASWVETEPCWRLMAPVPFALVCFRYAPEGVPDEEADALNERILGHVNASGEAYLSHTKLGGRFTLRVAIGNLRTERRHVARAWELLREAAAAMTERDARP
jgi:aromatic-L-amino-acid decarboxylase